MAIFVCIHINSMYTFDMFDENLFSHILYTFFLLPVDECMSTNELKIGKKIQFSIFSTIEMKLEKKIILFAFTIKYFSSTFIDHTKQFLFTYFHTTVCGWEFNNIKLKDFKRFFVNF